MLPPLFRHRSRLRTASIPSSESALTMTVPELPDENIFDILSRLPVKSLMRFKCVSKPWLTLISDPQFIRAHLFQQGKMDNSKILLSTQPHASIIDYEDCEKPIVELNYPSTSPCIDFVGCYDGLVCLLVDHQNFILWNPSTRESRQLPALITLSSCDYFTLHGFGYESSIDDYKVVYGYCQEDLVDNVTSVDNCIVEVFNLKSNKWKSIKFNDVGYNWYGLGTFLNGNLHWLSRYSESKKVVLSFNMKEEKFMEAVPLPVDCDFKNKELGLSASENSLFLWIPFCDRSPYSTVWKKNADVFEGSWIKLYNVSFDITPDDKLYITKYHKLVLTLDWDSIRAYDLETMISKDFPVECHDLVLGISYLESLVSPN